MKESKIGTQLQHSSRHQLAEILFMKSLRLKAGVLRLIEAP